MKYIFQQPRRVTDHDALVMIAVKLASEGRTHFDIPMSMIMDDAFDDLRIKVVRFEDKASYRIFLYSRNAQEPVEADYEIIDEPAALPQPPKQLTDGHNHDA
jgi:hypothetical protein